MTLIEDTGDLACSGESGDDEVSVMLDRTPYTSKAACKSDLPRISVRLGNSPAAVELRLLAQELTRGCSFVPALLRGGKRDTEAWTQQQVFALDFDNTLSVGEFFALTREHQVYPAFVYPTFSHTESTLKFRAVFVCDQIIRDVRLCRLTQGLLFRVFSMGTSRTPDSACLDLPHIYFGTDKALIREDYTQRINPVHLLSSCLAHIKKADAAHYADHCRKLASDLGLDYRHQHIGVEHVDVDTSHSSGERTVSAISNIALTVNSPDESPVTEVVHDGLVYRFRWKQYQPTTPSCWHRPEVNGNGSKAKTRLTEGVKTNLLSQCQLLAEFHSGSRHLGHQERRILLSNLRHLEGGVKWFEASLATRSDYRPDSQLFDSSLYDWKPERCSKCPYADTCEHGVNLLQQIKKRFTVRRVAPEPRTLSLEETRALLSQALSRCLSADDSKVYVIKSDCGVGKTHAVLQQELDNVCLACDTHNLKAETHERLRAAGRDTFLWPEPPPLPQELERFLSQLHGVGLKASRGVYRSAMAHPQIQAAPDWYRSVEAYVAAHEDIHTHSRILTTHAKAYQLQENPRLDTFIFDEDFVKTLVSISEVPLNDMETLYSQIIPNASNADDGLIDWLERVRAIPADQTVGHTASPEIMRRIEKAVANNLNAYHGPIAALPGAVAFRKDRAYGSHDYRLFAIARQPLRTDKKYIVLSATADEGVYRKLFGERLEFIDLSGTSLRGRIHCDTRNGFSKTLVSRDPKAFAQRVIADRNRLGFDGIITHKCVAVVTDPAPTLKDSEGKIPVYATFGGLQGVDYLAGKCLAVYGTPYPPQPALRLWAHLLGIGAGEQNFNFDEREVIHNGYEFRLPTHSDDADLNQLYLWLTASELIQAVGRARLVSRDADVHVFSRIPIPGCRANSV